MAYPTENAVLLKHTRNWFENSRWSVETWALEMLAPSLSEHGLIEPLLEPTSGDAYLKQRRAWGMRVGRIFHGTAPFPLEWKWVWIGCLPREYQEAARRDLMAIAGCLHVRLPTFTSASPEATRADLAELIRATGDFIGTCTPAHDGAYSAKDDPDAVEAMYDEGLGLIERVAAELIALETGTGCALPRQRLLDALQMGKRGMH